MPENLLWLESEFVMRDVVFAFVLGRGWQTSCRSSPEQLEAGRKSLRALGELRKPRKDPGAAGEERSLKSEEIKRSPRGERGQARRNE